MALGRYSPRGLRAHALVALAASTLLAPARAEDPDAAPDAIAWREDYSAALEEARAGGHPLWLQFTGPWCPNCLRMERDSFTQPAVRERAEAEFVPVKLRSEVNEELALSLGLSGLPASVIVDPSRRVLAAHEGYLGPDELSGFLDGAVAAMTAEREREAPANQTEQAAKATKDGDPIALSGYCPVSLASANRLVAGRDKFALTHEGRLYKFADEAALDEFQRDPDRYLPVNNGDCPVRRVDQGEAVAGDPRWGVSYRGNLYLCASEAEQVQFVENPDRYAAVDVEHGGFCPHCIALNGTLVQGDPRWDLAREGRRYWFPDSEHRRAFLAASATSTVRR